MVGKRGEEKLSDWEANGLEGRAGGEEDATAGGCAGEQESVLRPVPPPEKIQEVEMEEADAVEGGGDVAEVEQAEGEGTFGRGEGAMETGAGSPGAPLGEAEGPVEIPSGGRGERGQSNGLLNRRALTNGRSIVNGNGLVNGAKTGLINGGKRGAINGRGIVNGKGITNGSDAEVVEPPPRRLTKKGPLAALAIIVALVLITVSYYALLSTERGVMVDGVFSDWTPFLKYHDEAGDQRNADIDITQLALAVEDSSVSLYVRVGGRVLAGRDGGVDTFCFFFDTDRNPATGYPAPSVGAEYVLVVDGYDGRVSACGLYRFGGAGRSISDWNSRAPVGSARAASSGGELEAQVALADLGLRPDSGPNVQTLARHSGGEEDIGPVVGTGRAALTAVWARVGPVSVPPGKAGVPLLRVELRAQGGSVRVSSLRVSVNEGTGARDISRLSLMTASGAEVPGASALIANGSALLAPGSPLELRRGESMNLTVVAWIAFEAERGRAVGLSLEGPQSIISSADTVMVEGRGGNLTQIGEQAQPGRIIIDGAFQDWEGIPGHPDPIGDATNPSVDLRDFRVTNDSASLFLYAAVDGEIMAGAWVPETKQRPQPGGGGCGGVPAPLPELTGEDALFVFLDIDGLSETGYAGEGAPPGADYLVKITGRGGKITSHLVMPFTGGADRSQWSWGRGTELPAAAGGTGIELAVALETIGSPVGVVSLFYYMTGWGQSRDAGTEIEYSLSGGGWGRGAGAGDPPGAGPGFGSPEDSGDEPLHAPEFGELLLPIAGVIGIFAGARGARRRNARVRRGEKRNDGAVTVAFSVEGALREWSG
ncbi:MAG: hypothetical protein QXH42_02190 [Thermoplasmata archaeon]